MENQIERYAQYMLDASSEQQVKWLYSRAHKTDLNVEQEAQLLRALLQCLGVDKAIAYINHRAARERNFYVTSKPGMTPFASALSRRAAERESRKAKRLGLDGEIIAEQKARVFADFAGRILGGVNAPAEKIWQQASEWTLS